ncbi:TauD/TfdA family dioxygenase [Azospirillum sp. RWY-5-1]|uniref:TauD/TfdA family dioxygenase n=1 Tax=Azospirillum oleiclasticum TaxID=2735135 RepID=A0ABX2T7Q3_9PROT|nr:TauD/TfdA family dioxygenase [Azospirillum oleiclasticum]NYZ12665.1 TauD/TfdA family dioxygenase [Azospirillum oleiclasticum]NYZ19825.1 TauD/TfdA family dioxygenase [Azospirillum oleiclasticum]
MTSTPEYRHLELKPTGASFGIEVTNIDLARPQSDAVWEEIIRAYLDHRVMVFRGQELEPEHIVAASKRFGYTEAHIDSGYLLDGYPEIIKIGNLKVDGVMRSLFVNAREEWHFDYSYVKTPSIGALFYAVEIPPEGGDTLFADSTAAFDALDDAEKEWLRPLVAVHSWEELHRQLEAMDPTRKPLSAAAKAKYPPVRQPLVHKHPDTGRESLWLCPQVILEIEGMEREETRALVDRLQAHTISAPFHLRHKWRKGDLVVWDNRAVLHTATVFDYERHLRLLYRTTILAEAPAAAA